MDVFEHTTDIASATVKARELIASEVALQNKMWGDANERADHTKGQMMMAAMAQIRAIDLHMHGAERQLAFDAARVSYYPADWSGFRDYGSDIANLVVAAAYIEQEIKRRLILGEPSHRSARRPDQPYVPATGLPNKVEA